MAFQANPNVGGAHGDKFSSRIIGLTILDPPGERQRGKGNGKRKKKEKKKRKEKK